MLIGGGGGGCGGCDAQHAHGRRMEPNAARASARARACALPGMKWWVEQVMGVGHGQEEFYWQPQV